MVDVDSVLDDPALNNGPVPEFMRYWTDVTGAEQADVDDASGDARLIREALESGRSCRPVARSLPTREATSRTLAAPKSAP